MAWYDIPDINVNYLYDENHQQKMGVFLYARSWEKIAEAMEDLIDFISMEKIKIKKKTGKKPIQPQFLFDKNGKVKQVYLTIDDFNRFMDKLKRLSEEARKRVEKQKSLQK